MLYYLKNRGVTVIQGKGSCQILHFHSENSLLENVKCFFCLFTYDLFGRRKLEMFWKRIESTQASFLLSVLGVRQELLSSSLLFAKFEAKVDLSLQIVRFWFLKSHLLF